MPGYVFGNLKAETEKTSSLIKMQLDVQLLNSISMQQNTLAYSWKSWNAYNFRENVITPNCKNIALQLDLGQCMDNLRFKDFFNLKGKEDFIAIHQINSKE